MDSNYKVNICNYSPQQDLDYIPIKTSLKLAVSLLINTIIIMITGVYFKVRHIHDTLDIWHGDKI